MNIQFENAVAFTLPGPAWLPGILSTVTGGSAVQFSSVVPGITTELPDHSRRAQEIGDYVSVQPTGTIEGRTVVGTWETNTPSASINTLIYTPDVGGQKIPYALIYRGA